MLENQENENVTTEEEVYDHIIEGTLSYKIYLKDDKYKFESDVTPESEFIMLENTINALNQVRLQWSVLKQLIKSHPDKEIRKQAKESMPSADQKVRIDAAVYELEKIRDRIIWSIYQNVQNKESEEQSIETEQ